MNKWNIIKCGWASCGASYGARAPKCWSCGSVNQNRVNYYGQPMSQDEPVITQSLKLTAAKLCQKCPTPVELYQIYCPSCLAKTMAEIHKDPPIIAQAKAAYNEPSIRSQIAMENIEEPTIKCPLCSYDNQYDNVTCSNCDKPIGRKFDEGKTEWTLLPMDSIDALAKVMMFGAKKYARNNWLTVDPPNRYIDAAFRHLAAWVDGEVKDKETGYSHLWHAGCCIIFAIHLEIIGKLKPEPKEQG